MKFKIQGMELNALPIKIKENKLPDCDTKGRLVEKVYDQKSITSWKYADTGEEYTGKVVKLVDDVASEKFTRTKEIQMFKVVDKFEAMDMLEEKLYFVEIPELLKEKLGTDKAIKFVFSTGGGFCEYFAYIYEYGKYSVMKLSRASITNALENFAQTYKESVKVKQPEQIEVARVKSKLAL